MKKILLTAVCILTAACLHAQSSVQLNAAVIKSTPGKFPPGLTSVLSIDTIWTYVIRATNFYLYAHTPPNKGYITGTGYLFFGGNYFYISDATASHYDGIGNASVTELLVICGAKKIAGTADNLTANVYSIDQDTIPVSTLGTAAISTNDLDTTGTNFTSIPISASITSSFLVSLEYAGIDDTFGLITSDAATGDGNNENRIRQRFNPALGGGTWNAASPIYRGQLNCDVMIIPVVDIAIGMEEFDNGKFTLKPVYPSPAADHIILDYSLKRSADVSYRIFDKSGKIFLSEKSVNANEGRNIRTVNISNLAGGNYFLTFRQGKVTITQKFTVAR